MTNNSTQPTAREPVAISQRVVEACCSEMRSSSLMILARYSGPRSGGGSAKNQPACVFGVNSMSRLVMRMRCFMVGGGWAAGQRS